MYSKAHLQTPFYVIAAPPLRVSSLPAGERVGGEATVDDGQVRLEVGIAQIFEVFPQLGGRQQSLKQR